MKKDIHPDYHAVVFKDASTGHQFLTRSTATSDRTVEWEDGKEYPLIVVDVTSESHPFCPVHSVLWTPQVAWRSSSVATAEWLVARRSKLKEKEKG